MKHVTESKRNWIEDFQHENGQYQHTCSVCKKDYIGHKRRLSFCKVCFFDGMVKQISELEKEIDELKDFAIWMTGCGYDFCQHEYFRKQRDKLLK